MPGETTPDYQSRHPSLSDSPEELARAVEDAIARETARRVGDTTSVPVGPTERIPTVGGEPMPGARTLDSRGFSAEEAGDIDFGPGAAASTTSTPRPAVLGPGPLYAPPFPRGRPAAPTTAEWGGDRGLGPEFIRASRTGGTLWGHSGRFAANIAATVLGGGMEEDKGWLPPPKYQPGPAHETYEQEQKSKPVGRDPRWGDPKWIRVFNYTTGRYEWWLREAYFKALNDDADRWASYWARLKKAKREGTLIPGVLEPVRPPVLFPGQPWVGQPGPKDPTWVNYQGEWWRSDDLARFLEERERIRRIRELTKWVEHTDELGGVKVPATGQPNAPPPLPGPPPLTPAEEAALDEELRKQLGEDESGTNAKLAALAALLGMLMNYLVKKGSLPRIPW